MVTKKPIHINSIECMKVVHGHRFYVGIMMGDNYTYSSSPMRAWDSCITVGTQAVYTPTDVYVHEQIIYYHDMQNAQNAHEVTMQLKNF